MNGLRLGVNIDHVATLRQARYATMPESKNAEPDPLIAVRMCERAGAGGIVAHLRADRRHIQDRDIQLGHDVLAQPLNISVLNVPAISPQMGNNPTGSSPLAHSRSNERIGLRILGFRHRGVPRLPQRCYVIDVDSQTQSAHWLRKSRELIAA